MKQSRLLLVVILPFISFLFIPNAAVCLSIDNIVFSPAPLSAVPFNTQINVSFDYINDEAGINIMVNPFTNILLTPNYGWSGAGGVLPPGSGNKSLWFTVSSGETIVDRVRFSVYNSDWTTLFYEFYVPVTYQFHASPSSVTNIGLSAYSPSSLAFSKFVSVKFDYENSQPDNILIWAIPKTNGVWSQNASYTVLSLPVGTGNGTNYFTIYSGDTTVDQVEILVRNTTQTITHFTFHVPVRYLFRTDPELPPTLNGAKQGDFDGDGKTDLAVYRSSTAVWYILQSIDGYDQSKYKAYLWGGDPNDIPVPGDYDGDGKTDIAVYRSSTGVWYLLQSTTGYNPSLYKAYLWGNSTDTPVPGDFDGDGKADITVFRPSAGIWYILQSSDGFDQSKYKAYKWGDPASGDKPVSSFK